MTTRASLLAARSALDALLADDSLNTRLDRAADDLARTLARGDKVLACGNGGSACDAMHFCEELTGRFRRDRKPLPAVACIDPGHITCTANDYGYDAAFARWVEALGRRGDALVLLSTSGNSPTVLNAAEAAKRLGLTTIAMLGREGGALRGRCSHEFLIPADTTDRVQELHMLLLHVLVEGIEARLFPA